MTHDCKTCPVSTGTHQPAEALHQIAEPDAGSTKVLIDFDQVGTAGPFAVVDGRVLLPAETMLDLARMLNPTSDALAAAPQAVQAAVSVVNEDLQDLVSKAMRRAWQLGQTYWQQADSDYFSQQNKSDDTQAKFNALIEETRAAIAATHPTQQGLDAQRWQIVHNRISGEYIAGRACFVVQIAPVPGVSIMRGSVAEHFIRAVDFAASQAKQGEQANGAE